MPCYLLHMVEMPDPKPYDDEELKDLVGEFPRLYCAHCTPPRELATRRERALPRPRRTVLEACRPDLRVASRGRATRR